MQCTTVKNGIECSFMGKSGCGFLGGACRPIDEKCEGCERTMIFEEQKFCKVFPDPAVKWRLGECTMSTHIKHEVKAETAKTRVGQQKQKRK